MIEEITKLKAEIFDMIRQQESYIVISNSLQQKRIEKMQEIKNVEQTGNPEDITKLKSQAYDIIVQQERYIETANKIQQEKVQKLQILNNMEETTRSQQTTQDQTTQQK